MTDHGNAMAVQRDGKIVVVGYTDRGAPTGHDFAVARFKPNGKLDKTFSGDGRATMAIASGTHDDEAYGVASPTRPSPATAAG